ncbi:MAG: hypothetical protein IPL65_13020 [Lewinellaceae bacterium]|nr:hypothetical protein [Lewinellaceae bacterium]
MIERGLILVVDIINGLDNTPLIPTVLYLDDELADTSTVSVNLETNTYTMPIHFGGRYKILGESDGFFPDSLEFPTPRVTKKPKDTIFQTLILYPACLKCYTPITLFFDNDKPERIRNAKGQPIYIDSTATHYFDTWTAYLQRQDIYKDKHSSAAVFSPAQAQLSRDSLDRFFADSVRANGQRLNKFMEVMDVYLESGAEVKLILKGFASPLASSEYNKRLTNRRITSLTKWMLEQYRSGLLLKYYRPEPGGKQTLNWDRIANGEAGTQNIPDGSSESARKWSVYSVIASESRKAQVADVIVKDAPKLMYRDPSVVPPHVNCCSFE